MATLTNTQIKDTVNELYSVMNKGETLEEPIDVSDIVDNGKYEVDELEYEKWTKGLIAVLTKRWYQDESYRSNARSRYYVDSREFGGIVSTVSATVPNVIDNEAWGDFVSGVTTIGSHTVFMPVVTEKFFAKTVSWSLPISISSKQMNDAFRGVNEFDAFVNFILMRVEDGVMAHIENLDDLNRNTFIAEKILYSNKEDAKGIHVIDLIGKYVADKGITTAFTIEDAMWDREFLAFASEQMKHYLSMFKKQTSFFNTEGVVRFTPESRLTVEILEDFENRMSSLAYANTFHDEFIKLPNHYTTPWWMINDGATGDISFDDASSIHIETENGTVERSGIVGLITDKWAIANTIREDRVAHQYDDIVAIHNYRYQHRDAYMCNLSLNGVVFVMNDYNPESTS